MLDSRISTRRQPGCWRIIGLISFSRTCGSRLMEPELASKWLELLKEIAPRIDRVAFPFNPATPPYADFWLKPFKAAAAFVAPVRARSELESAVAAQAARANPGPWSDAGAEGGAGWRRTHLGGHAGLCELHKAAVMQASCTALTFGPAQAAQGCRHRTRQQDRQNGLAIKAKGQGAGRAGSVNEIALISSMMMSPVFMPKTELDPIFSGTSMLRSAMPR